MSIFSQIIKFEQAETGDRIDEINFKFDFWIKKES